MRNLLIPARPRNPGRPTEVRYLANKMLIKGSLAAQASVNFFTLIFLISITQSTTASPITVTYNFSVGGFTAFSAPPAADIPVTQISGSFTTTFETITGEGTNSATLDAIDLSINGFNYTLSNTELIVRNAKLDTDLFSGRFEIGGTENGGVFGSGDFSDDFNLFFTDSGNPTGFSSENFRYTVAARAGFFDATTFDISRSTVLIPEPNSLILTLAALATFVWWRVGPA